MSVKDYFSFAPYSGPDEWEAWLGRDAREAGDSRLLAAIREAEGARVDEDERAAA